MAAPTPEELAADVASLEMLVKGFEGLPPATRDAMLKGLHELQHVPVQAEQHEAQRQFLDTLVAAIRDQEVRVQEEVATCTTKLSEVLQEVSTAAVKDLEEARQAMEASKQMISKKEESAAEAAQKYASCRQDEEVLERASKRQRRTWQDTKEALDRTCNAQQSIQANDDVDMVVDVLKEAHAEKASLAALPAALGAVASASATSFDDFVVKYAQDQLEKQVVNLTTRWETMLPQERSLNARSLGLWAISSVANEQHQAAESELESGKAKLEELAAALELKKRNALEKEAEEQATRSHCKTLEDQLSILKNAITSVDRLLAVPPAAAVVEEKKEEEIEEKAAPVEEEKKEEEVEAAPAEDMEVDAAAVEEKMVIAAAPVEEAKEQEVVAAAPVEEGKEQEVVAAAPVEEEKEQEVVAPVEEEKKQEVAASENKELEEKEPEEKEEVGSVEVSTAAPMEVEQVEQLNIDSMSPEQKEPLDAPLKEAPTPTRTSLESSELVASGGA